MIRKKEVIEKANECVFGDIGVTTAEPFDSQKSSLLERQNEYAWVFMLGLDLIAGTGPKQIFPEARSIIVLMDRCRG